MKLPILPLAFALGLAASAQTLAQDPWASLRFLAGEWTGTSLGQPGKGTSQRTYQFVLARRFLQERSVTTFEPAGIGKPGDVHEHWSLISYDRKRKHLVLRQFHQEGLVSQYALDEELSSARRLVFTSEGFENLDDRWRVRETFDLVSDDAFTETFELAPPGKAFSVYVKSTFTRAGAR